MRQRARQRAANRQDRTVRVGRNTRRVVRAGPYRYARGARYQVYRRGERFPASLLLASYFLTNFATYYLSPPPVGYRWVRFGPDAVLVDLSSYEVMDTRYGVFYEGDVSEGAASSNPPDIDPDLPEEFISGELQLEGGGCEDFYGEDEWLDYVDEAWSDEDWNELAGTVIDSGCESDLSYYLLGLSAEGLELEAASASYYQRALDLADERFQDNCDAWGQGACRDVDVGREAEAGLERVYARG